VVIRWRAGHDEYTLCYAQEIESRYKITLSIHREPIIEDVKGLDDPESNNTLAPINAIQEQTTINITTTDTNATEEAAQGFEYLSNYGILVYKEHGFRLRNLRRHLLEQHAYSRHTRDVIIERFGSLNIVNPEDTPLPTSVVEPFECLRALRAALRCTG
jgi:hypothetical protein